MRSYDPLAFGPGPVFFPESIAMRWLWAGILFALGIGGLAIGLLGSLGSSTDTAVKPGQCKPGYVIDSTDDDWYVPANGHIVVAELEPDTGGAGLGTQVSIYTCAQTDANSCVPWIGIDSNYDGIPDTNVMDGSGSPLATRVVVIPDAAKYVLFDTTAYQDDGLLVVCGR